MRVCKSLNRRGKPCGANPFKDELYCLWHSPSEKGKRLREKGEENRKRIMRLLYGEEYGTGKKNQFAITPYQVLRDFKKLRRKLLADDSIRPDKKFNALVKLDKYLHECLEIIYKEAERQKESFEEKLRRMKKEKPEKHLM